MSSEKGREGFFLASYQYQPPQLQDYTFIRDQVEQNKKEINRR